MPAVARVVVIERGQTLADPPRRVLPRDVVEVVACASPNDAARLGGDTPSLLVVAAQPGPPDLDALAAFVRDWAARLTGQCASAVTHARRVRADLDQALDRAQTAREALRRAATAPATRLTAREAEVAALVAHGLSTAEIAGRLTVTPGTVSNHLAHILRKLSLRNRVQVAVWAVEKGIARPDTVPHTGTTSPAPPA